MNHNGGIAIPAGAVIKNDHFHFNPRFKPLCPLCILCVRCGLLFFYQKGHKGFTKFTKKSFNLLLE
jgi:hypothetical protein